MRLTPEEWEDAADLMEQFIAQCEIAFEEHAPHAKRWCIERMSLLRETADKRSAHPRRRKCSVDSSAKVKP